MKLLRTALAAAAIALTGAAAHADELEVFSYTGHAMFDTADDNLSSASSYTIGALYRVAGNPTKYGVGPLVIKNYTDRTSFVAFCIEPHTSLAADFTGDDDGATTYSYTKTAITDPVGSGFGKVQRLFDLWGYQTSTKLDDDPATIALWGSAMQLAIWNLMFDSDMDLDTGTFAVLNGSTILPVMDLSEQMIRSVYLDPTPAASKQMTLWNANGSQDLISSAGVIPEPSSYALALAGIGIVGYSLRRRQHKAA